MIFWIKAAETGRPNDQRARLIEVLSDGKLRVEMQGDGAVLDVRPMATCGVEFSAPSGKRATVFYDTTYWRSTT